MVRIFCYGGNFILFYQALREHLSNKEIEIEQVKQLGTTLMEIEHDMPSSTRGGTITQTSDNLNTQWADLDHKVRNLITLFPTGNQMISLNLCK